MPSAVDAPEAIVLIETAEDVWEDISEDLRSGTVTRGRQQELDTYEAGRATLVFSNADRAYDPTYEDGPYAGKLKPNTRMQVKASQNSVTYPIFYGYLDGIAESRSLGGDAVAVMSLTDAFKVLNRAKMFGRSFSSQLPGARLGELLDLVDFPAGQRDIDTGVTTLQAGTYESTLLAHAQLVAQTEFGDFFVAADGTIRFLQRDALLNDESEAVFGDGPGELGYRALTPTYDDTLIRNPVSVDREGGIRQTVEDATLKLPPPAGYGDNHFTMEGLLHDSDALSLDAAGYILFRYKEPQRRVTGLEIGPPDAAQAEILYPQMLGRDLTDRILIIERPGDVGWRVEQSSVITGITHTFRPKLWVTRWNVAPPFAAGVFWQIGIAGKSEIGTTTKVYF